jgi:hypothetical protein
VNEASQAKKQKLGFGTFAVIMLLAVVVGPAVSLLLREALGFESGLATAIGFGLTLPPVAAVATRGGSMTDFRTLLALAIVAVVSVVTVTCVYMVAHDSLGIASWLAGGIGTGIAVGIGVLTMRRIDPLPRR